VSVVVRHRNKELSYLLTYMEDISNSLSSSSSRSSRRSLMRKVRSALEEGGGELSEASGAGDCDLEPPDATVVACGTAHGSCSRAPWVTSSLKQSSRLMIPPNVYGWTTRIQLSYFQQPPLLLLLLQLLLLLLPFIEQH